MPADHIMVTASYSFSSSRIMSRASARILKVTEGCPPAKHFRETWAALGGPELRRDINFYCRVLVCRAKKRNAYICTSLAKAKVILLSQLADEKLATLNIINDHMHYERSLIVHVVSGMWSLA